jgi:hypothetical protein
MTPEETRAIPLPSDSPYLDGSVLPPANPMPTRAKVLGIFFALFAVMYLGIFLYVMVTMGANGVSLAHQPAPAGSRASEQSAAQIVGISMLFGGAFAGIFAIFGGCALAAAVGLLAKKPWGRTAAIVASFPLLISIPFGTILGICTFVMMLGAEAKQNYARLAAGS